MISFPALLFSQENELMRSMADRNMSSITYSMRHPLHAWSGTSNEVSSVILSKGTKEDIVQVAVSARVASFDSKNANRDSHMLEVTRALQYPNITFSGNVESRENNQLFVKGELNFHGLIHLLDFSVNIRSDGDKLHIAGGFEVLLSDFNIQRPTLMGIPTSNEIKLEFTMVY
jgi:polyisoprenoid-binding protein YceI